MSRRPADADSDLDSEDFADQSPAPSPMVPLSGLSLGGISSASSNNRVERRGMIRRAARRHWMVTYWCQTVDEVLPAYMDMTMANIRARGSQVSLDYAVWQVECCPTTQRLHIHMYMEFDRTVYASFVCNLFPDPRKCYAEPKITFTSREDCISYCTKEHTRVAGPWEFGSRETQEEVSQGKRSDISRVVSIINNGGNMEDIMKLDGNVMLRMPNGIRTAISVIQKRDAPKDRDIKVVVLFGGTGSGKTSGIVHGVKDRLYTVDSTMISTGGNGGIWWDGYAGEKTVLFDDYDNWVSTADLLRLLDRYTVKIQSKGASSLAYYERLFITSNKAPWEWKDGRTGKEPFKPHRAALMRRMHTVAEVFPHITVLHKRNGVILNTERILTWTGEERELDDYTKQFL